MREVIMVNPARTGLATAGKQGVIDETQLWQAKNISVDLDGGLMKRPGIEQHGQVLKHPVGDATFNGLLHNLDAWSNYASSTYIESSADNGVWRTAVNPNTGAAETATWGTSFSDSDYADSWGLRWVHRFADLPDDAFYQMATRAQVAENLYGIRIYDDGIYTYASSTWTLAYAFDFQGKGAQSIEMRYDGTDLTVYVSNTLVLTQTSPQAVSAADSSTHIEATFSAAYSTLHVVYLYDMQFGSGSSTVDGDTTLTAPFADSSLVDGIDFERVEEGNAIRRRMIVATKRRLYVDYDLRGIWTPVLDLDGNSLYITKFSNKLIIFDSGKLYEWKTDAAPELLDDAPEVRYGGEYKKRLFAAGDHRHPRRVYFTAANQPNVWFSTEDDASGEETIDEVLGAGYINAPGQDGGVVTAVWGDFYGTCIFTTATGIGRISGASPLSFAVEFINASDGAAGPRCLTRVGNDLWLLGQRGITTLRTVIEYGDMQTANPSATIADMWTAYPNSGIRVNLELLHEASMTWSPTEGLAYVCFRPVGHTAVDTIYVFSVLNKSWYGPWTSESSFVRSVVIDSPTAYVVLHGTADGKVGMSSAYKKSDYGTAYKATIESALMSGRSRSPMLNSRPKRWRELNLHIAPKGLWNLVVRWSVDNETRETITEGQNQYDIPVLGDDFRLTTTDARLASRQLIAIVAVKLDMRGHYFKFDLSTADDDDNEDFVLHGFEVEYLVDSDEEVE